MDFESYGIFIGKLIKLLNPFCFCECKYESYDFQNLISMSYYIMELFIDLQDGMGQLKVVPGGLQLSGQAWVVDQLRASNIRSRFGQPISLGKRCIN